MVRIRTEVGDDVSSFQGLWGIASRDRAARFVSVKKLLTELQLPSTANDRCQDPFATVCQALKIRRFRCWRFRFSHDLLHFRSGATTVRLTSWREPLQNEVAFRPSRHKRWP